MVIESFLPVGEMQSAHRCAGGENVSTDFTQLRSSTDVDGASKSKFGFLLYFEVFPLVSETLESSDFPS